jgi:lipoprotein-anchoring transpeptidase ErfK/SrfK
VQFSPRSRTDKALGVGRRLKGRLGAAVAASVATLIGLSAAANAAQMNSPQLVLPMSQASPRGTGFQPATKSSAVASLPMARSATNESVGNLDGNARGSLSVIISLDRQQLTLYSDGLPIATSRVSTGRPGHSTPTGVFSIIEKDRWHHSNVYDDAPMYFMQRLTWSGVALHQGVVPNYPASHGCIRLPEAFARQLWSATKLGVRVIVVRGNAEPVAISHPRLFHQRDQVVAKSDAALTPAQLVEAAFNSEVYHLDRPKADLAIMTNLTFAQSPTTLVGGAKIADSLIQIAEPTPSTPQSARTVAPLTAHPISVLISREEGRLFVRKGFEPVFDLPVIFEKPDHPIGTHVFTALASKEGNQALRWIVVSVPTADTRTSISAGAAEALERITIPQEAIDRISDLISPGASLIISDQGPGPETDVGTDFIVLTH